MAKTNKTKKNDIHPIGRSLLWIETPDNIGRIIAFLAVMCLFLFIADFTIYRKSYFELEAMPGFYGVFGFLAFSFIIFGTKLLKLLINRKENYYGKSSVDAEDYPAEGLEKKGFRDE